MTTIREAAEERYPLALGDTPITDLAEVARFATRVGLNKQARLGFEAGAKWALQQADDAVRAIPCWIDPDARVSEFDIPGESHRDTVRAAIREIGEEK